MRTYFEEQQTVDAVVVKRVAVLLQPDAAQEQGDSGDAPGGHPVGVPLRVAQEQGLGLGGVEGVIVGRALYEGAMEDEVCRLNTF